MIVYRKMLDLFIAPSVILRTHVKVWACRITQTNIRRLQYFRIDEPRSILEHDVPNSLFKTLVIVLSPVVATQIVGLTLMILMAIVQLKYSNLEFIYGILMYLSVTILAQTYSTWKEVKLLNNALSRTSGISVLKIFGYLSGFVMLISSVGSYVLINVLYAFMMMNAMPEIVSSWL